MHCMFTMDTTWSLAICRISGCRHKSGKGFNGEKVRVRTTNRKQAGGQERGLEASYRGTQRAHSSGSDHPQKPVSSLGDGILDDTVCVCTRARACFRARMRTHEQRKRERRERRRERGEGERERERDRRKRRKRKGKRRKRRYYFSLKIFCSLLKPLQ